MADFKVIFLIKIVITFSGEMFFFFKLMAIELHGTTYPAGPILFRTGLNLARIDYADGWSSNLDIASVEFYLRPLSQLELPLQ